MKALIFLLAIVFLNALAIGISAQMIESETLAVSNQQNSTEPDKTEGNKNDEKNSVTSGEDTKISFTDQIAKDSAEIFEVPQEDFNLNTTQKPLKLAAAPKTQNDDDEYNKGEIYLGYSGALVIDDEFGFEGGVNVAGVYYFHRYIGAKVDFSATFQPISSGDHELYNLTGGLQFKDSSKSKRLKPFAHVLVGYAKHKDSFDNFPQFSLDRNGVSTIFGGGLDIKVSDNIDIRAFQVDINAIFLEDTTGFNGTYSNIRYGAGVVFNF